MIRTVIVCAAMQLMSCVLSHQKPEPLPDRRRVLRSDRRPAGAQGDSLQLLPEGTGAARSGKWDHVITVQYGPL